MDIGGVGGGLLDTVKLNNSILVTWGFSNWFEKITITKMTITKILNDHKGLRSFGLDDLYNM